MKRGWIFIACVIFASVVLAGISRPNFPISIAISPQGDFVLVGNEENPVEVRALPGLELVRALESEKGSYVRWHAKLDRAVVFADHLWIYDTQSWALLHHSIDVFTDVALHPEKPLLLGIQQTGESQHALVICELKANPTRMSFAILDEKPNRIAYLGHEQVAVFGRDGIVRVYDLSTRQAMAQTSIAELKGPLAVDALPAQKIVAALSQDTGKLFVLRIPDLTVLKMIEAHKPGYAETLHFEPSGKFLATGGGYPDSNLKFWDISTGASLGHKVGIQVMDLAFHPKQPSAVVCNKIHGKSELVQFSEVLDELHK